jgi:hypothetical protein
MDWKTELTPYVWKKWFAIYPVCVDIDRSDEDRHWRVWVWLETVERSQLGKAVVYRKIIKNNSTEV